MIEKRECSLCFKDHRHECNATLSHGFTHFQTRVRKRIEGIETKGLGRGKRLGRVKNERETSLVEPLLTTTRTARVECKKGREGGALCMLVRRPSGEGGISVSEFAKERKEGSLRGHFCGHN